jgi:hypothetical protein
MFADTFHSDSANKTYLLVGKWQTSKLIAVCQLQFFISSCRCRRNDLSNTTYYYTRAIQFPAIRLALVSVTPPIVSVVTLPPCMAYCEKFRRGFPHSIYKHLSLSVITQTRGSFRLTSHERGNVDSPPMKLFSTFYLDFFLKLAMIWVES